MTEDNRHDESSDRQDISDERQDDAQDRVNELELAHDEARRVGLQRMERVVNEISGLREDTQEQTRKVDERRGRERILNVLLFLILCVVSATGIVMNDNFHEARQNEIERAEQGAKFMVDFIACDQGNAEHHRINTYNHIEATNPDTVAPAPPPRQTVKLSEQELYEACKRLADGIYFQVEGNGEDKD